jgi:hypothetical protein
MDFVFFTCRVQKLPNELRQEAGKVAMRTNSRNIPKVHRKYDIPNPVLASKWWTSKVTLPVGFINISEPELRTRILWHMNSWSEFCNVLFIAENDLKKASIRISCYGPNERTDVDRGCWSYLGTDVLQFKDTEMPTMSLGNLDLKTDEFRVRRAVRHLTGHVLGFEHEHFHSAVIDLIDQSKRNNFFKTSPRNWDDASITKTFIDPLKNDDAVTAPISEPHSIMCHPINSDFMKDEMQYMMGGLEFTDFDRNRASEIYPLSVPGWKEIGRHPAVADIMATNGYLYQLRTDHSIWRYSPFVGFDEGTLYTKHRYSSYSV